jgi:hypothetical protein
MPRARRVIVVPTPSTNRGDDLWPSRELRENSRKIADQSKAQVPPEIRGDPEGMDGTFVFPRPLSVPGS